MKKQQGFTLVELIIVIVVIAILATLATLGLTGYRNDANDARADSNITSLTEALEKYYDENGEYPGCGILTGPATEITSSVLKGLDQSALTVPNAPSGTTNSIKCGQTLALTGESFIQYTGDGSADCNGSGSCLSYTIRYRKEGAKEIVSVPSRRTATIATSGVPVITANTTGFSTIDVSWTPTANASNYSVQRATNATFTTGLSSATVSASTTTRSFTSLATGTTYYFRVKATRTGDETAWSNIDSAKTDALYAPTVTAAVNSSTRITASWSAVDLASSYEVQQSTSSGFASPTAFTLTTRSQAYDALTQGGRYYYRVRAIAQNGSSTVNGPWSSAINTTTTVNAPSAPSMNNPTASDQGSYDLTNFSWNPGSTCPAGTEMQYQRKYSYDYPYDSGWYGVSTAANISVSTYDGFNYVAQAQARCRNTTTGVVSSWSGASSRSMLEDVRAPNVTGWAFSRDGDRTVRMQPTGSCRAYGSLFGHMVEYSGSLPWSNGPKSGQRGWWTDSGYRIYNVEWPNGGSVNSYAIPGGSQYKAKGEFTCRNYITGRTGGWVFNESGFWYW